MNLIRSIRIAGFRSILDEKLENCGEHVVLVGKNSCGKSNVLRALNVFFNGETSPGVPIDFERDIYFRPTRKQKKQISISVEFELPDRFKFRKGLSHLAALGSRFTIVKSWQLDQLRRVEEQAATIVDDEARRDGSREASDFLSLIRFRYIPNRTVPAELLRDESQVIAGAIFKKMKETSKANDVLRGMSTSAGKLLTATTEALRDSGSPLQDPNIMTSSTLGEMLRMTGFQAKGLNGATVRDEDWGAGHQAFFLMNLLREIDTDYSRQFGWRQACIWAVEEPESGLHHDLQTNLARHFYDWASDRSRRLQIFTTTHAPVLAMSGDSGCLVELDDVSSRLRTLPISDLVRQAEDRGVTTYLHPAMAFPFNPVVLVEGHIDEKVMNHTAQVFGKSNIRFATLPSLETGESAGVDALQHYLKRNQKLLAKRQPGAPLIALVDWEISDDQLSKLRSAYGPNGDDYVVRCDKAKANPLLGPSFKGIERFYPEALVRSAHHAGECSVGFPSDESKAWSISPDELSKAKLRLSNRLIEVEDPAKLAHLLSVLMQVVRASNAFADRQMKLAV